MTNGKKERASQEPLEETRSEVEAAAQQIIKDFLLPLQTKKLSKKMIEQIATECAEKIAEQAVLASRKASSRQASKLTREFSQILSDQDLRSTPVFNDKLSAFNSQLSPEDMEKLQKDREKAAQVVSQVYKSIFNFARDIGIKAGEPAPADEKAKK